MLTEFSIVLISHCFFFFKIKKCSTQFWIHLPVLAIDTELRERTEHFTSNFVYT